MEPIHYTIAQGGTVSGQSATSYINGELRQYFNDGNSVVDFPVGDGTFYTPASINVNDAVALSMAVSTTPGDHFDINSSSFDPDKTVNRAWKVRPSRWLFYI